MTIYPESPGLVFLKFPFDRQVIEALKEHPGKAWDAARRGWKFPEASLGNLELPAGWKFLDKRPPKAEIKIQSTSLHPYQLEGITKALNTPGQMLCWDMGLGKSRGAIECMKSVSAKRILIACPASVRTTWRDQMTLWWPERVPEMHLVEPTHKPKASRVAETAWPIVVTSYELLHKVPPSPWDCIVLDESSFLKEARSTRSERAAALRKANPRALIILLTGTPATEPVDLHHQIDLIAPGALGNWYAFVNKFCNVEANKWTKYGSVYGVKAGMEDLLRERLSPFIHRATLAEWGHLMPPLRTHKIVVKTPRKWRSVRAVFDETHRVHENKYSNYLLDAADIKIPAAVDWAEASGTRSAIVTYQVSTAQQIAERLGERAVLVTGAISASTRKDIAASLSDTQVLVASMRSIEMGIDLSYINRVCFAEMYWSLITMSQVLKRFHRLNSKTGVDVYFLVGEGTLDDAIASTLKRRADSVGSAIGGGGTEGVISDGLADEPQTEEEWQERFFQMAEGV